MNSLPSIEIDFPVNPKIKNHIAYYYFLKVPEKKGSLDFWHYPHYQTTLVLFKNAEITVDNDVRYITSVNVDNFVGVFNNNVKGAKKEVLNGSFNIIGIVFNPLGANHFRSLDFQNVEYALASEISELYQTISVANRTRILDNIFEELYHDFQAPILNRAIDLIIDRKGHINLHELSTILKISRRTILRYFKIHLNCSFQDFKTIVKFRLTLKEKNLTKLSDLAYGFNYYDQSDLIKVFKSKTNETPKKLLTRITRVSEKLLWKVDS